MPCLAGSAPELEEKEIDRRWSNVLHFIRSPGYRGLWARKKSIGVKIPDSPPSTSASAAMFNSVLTAEAPSGNTRNFSPTLNTELVRVRPTGVRGILLRLRSRPCKARYQGISGSDSEATSRDSRSSNPAVRNAVHISDAKAISGSASPTQCLPLSAGVPHSPDRIPQSDTTRSPQSRPRTQNTEYFPECRRFVRCVGHGFDREGGIVAVALGICM